MRYSTFFILLFTLASGNALAAGEHGHDENQEHAGERGDEHGDEENLTSLTAEQIEAAGIEIVNVQRSDIADIVVAPGEVTLNAYQTTRVAPRIEALITERHARLGESVEPGQSLVTLSSVQLAEAQGELAVSDREWKRVKKLGRKVVSERRYIEAQVARQQAAAKVHAYGMTDEQIDALLKGSDTSTATGELELLSPQAGTIIRDNFIVGELAEPGRELFTITDERNLWVEARLSPEDAVKVQVGSPARIKVRKNRIDGVVVQAGHMLDESTRTLSVRVEISNPDDQLHPGQFVNVELQSEQHTAEITVPLAAVLRSPDGDWQVFLEEAPGKYEAREVEVLRTVGKQMVVDGLKKGDRIVSKGAFFVQSEIAKSGFEVHNH